jgi:hypothetical protein
MIPIPLHDHIRRQTFWLFTLLLIITNILTFIFEISLGQNVDRLVFYFGIIPVRYTNPHFVAEVGLPGLLLPIFASMFLHGGWLHVLGNMLFLFVFGRSIEDRFGHLKFLFIYFLGGLGGALLHILLNAGSRTPTIGASGAIAGILGAYFISYPAARITTLVPILFFFWTIEVPALLLLGYWFLIQFFTGFQMQAIQTATHGGVAWWAHVGGFLVGLTLAATLRPRRRRPAVEVLD